MRIMEIPSFPGSKIQLTDWGWLIKIRVTKDLIFWPRYFDAPGRWERSSLRLLLPWHGDVHSDMEYF